MKIIDRFLVYVTIFLTSSTIAAGVFLAFINVVARFFFNKGIEWAFELTSYLFIWSAFFGAAYLFRVGGHIRVTILVDILPPKVSKMIIILSDLIVLFYLILVAYYGYIFIFDPELGLKESGEVSVSLGVPIWYVYTIVPISMVIGAIFTIFKLIEDIKAPVSEIIKKETIEKLGEVE